MFYRVRKDKSGWEPRRLFAVVEFMMHNSCGQSDALAVPQLGSCASSGRACRLQAARHSQEEAGPLGV